MIWNGKEVKEEELGQRKVDTLQPNLVRNTLVALGTSEEDAQTCNISAMVGETAKDAMKLQRRWALDMQPFSMVNNVLEAKLMEDMVRLQKNFATMNANPVKSTVEVSMQIV